MTRYYQKVTGKSGKKFLIYYIKKHPYWQCDKCNKLFTKGASFKHIINTETYIINKNIEKIVKTIHKITLNDKKQEIVHSPGFCEGTIKFKGWKIWVEDITNRQVTNFGSFGISTGVENTERVFVELRDHINIKVKQLAEKYQEM
ncbi:MAG: hypothetical protein M0R03_11525 [Novosphingobium sp.]|nr:hypothetical protein [Novosphingobium sp.]